MLDQVIVRENIAWSSYKILLQSSSVWIVLNKLDASGKQKWRIIFDCGKLNENSIDYKYTLLIIFNLLDQLGRS